MSEIRLRNVKPELMKLLNEVKRMLHEKTITGAIEKLPTRYLWDQKAIRELQKRNSQLHKAINKYYSKEDATRRLIERFIVVMSRTESESKSLVRECKKLVKLFGTKRLHK